MILYIVLMTALIVVYTVDIYLTHRLNKLKREFNDLLLEQNRLLKRIIFGEQDKEMDDDEQGGAEKS